MSAEPAADRAGHIIPQGVLESSVKITNEPPTGMLANLSKAFDNFNQVCMLEVVSVSSGGALYKALDWVQGSEFCFSVRILL